MSRILEIEEEEEIEIETAILSDSFNSKSNHYALDGVIPISDWIETGTWIAILFFSLILIIQLYRRRKTF